MHKAQNIEHKFLWQDKFLRGIYGFANAQPSHTQLAIPCSLRSHRIANRTHENVGKSSTSILYRKNYKMSTQYLPPFSCLCQHTLSKVTPQYSGTQGIYVIICLSLRSNRQSLSRQQGIILIKTANAVILPIVDKKMDFFGNTGIFESNCRIGKRTEWHATVYNKRFGSMAGVTRRKVLQNSKLNDSWQMQVARHCAKPPGVRGNSRTAIGVRKKYQNKTILLIINELTFFRILLL